MGSEPLMWESSGRALFQITFLIKIHRVEARRRSEGGRPCSQHHCFNFAQLKVGDSNFLLAVPRCSHSLSPSLVPTASVHVEDQSHTAQNQSLPCLQYLSKISTAALKVP